MKKILILSALLVGAAAYAQTDAASYAARYERQVRNVGAAGVGVETILDRWEADFPDDPAVYDGRSKFYLAKSMSSSVVAKEGSKYLGADPLLSLPSPRRRLTRPYRCRLRNWLTGLTR